MNEQSLNELIIQLRRENKALQDRNAFLQTYMERLLYLIRKYRKEFKNYGELTSYHFRLETRIHNILTELKILVKSGLETYKNEL